MVGRRQFFTITNLLKVHSVLAAKMSMETKFLKHVYTCFTASFEKTKWMSEESFSSLTPNKPTPGYFSPLGKVLKITGKGRSEESHGKVGGFCGGPFKTIEALSAGVNCLHVEGSLLGGTSSSLWLCSSRVNSCVAGPLYILLDIAVMLVHGRLTYSTVSTDALSAAALLLFTVSDTGIL